MAKNLKFSAVLKNAQQACITTAMGASGLLRFYDGAQPASPDVAISSQNLLAELPCSATVAGAPASGVLTLNPISNGTGTAAAGTGTTTTWFRYCTSAGVGVADGLTGVTTSDMNINNMNIATGQVVSCSGYTFTNQQ